MIHKNFHIESTNTNLFWVKIMYSLYVVLWLSFGLGIKNANTYANESAIAVFWERSESFFFNNKGLSPTKVHSSLISEESEGINIKECEGEEEEEDDDDVQTGHKFGYLSHLKHNSPHNSIDVTSVCVTNKCPLYILHHSWKSFLS
jgi:hypothetical protein